jgi:putative methyltransferase
MNILLNEFQLEMPGGATYLPYASGLLAAYAQKNSAIRDLRFYFNEQDSCRKHMDARGYSVSQWNLNRSLQDAEQYPNSRIVFGGPSSSEVKDYPAIIGEGEYAFAKWLDTGSLLSLPYALPNIDDIPSPYTTGLFEGLVGPQSQAIVETVRGCPFGCAYCAWGKGGKAGKNVRMHSLAYVQEEAEWMGINKIKYVFCADGNFGMFTRDVQVAKIYADVKRKYGYPERFRVCFGKNAEESIFETASILAEAGLIKAVTLSRQSTNPIALASVGRGNVSQQTFDRLQDRYAETGIPTYSELILGLPGETYESWKQSIIDSMRRETQLFLYPLSALPGSRLNEIDYRMAYGIRTRRVLLTPAHCIPPAVAEYEDIVVETNTLDPEEWRKAMVLGWLVQLFYSFKLMSETPESIVVACEAVADPSNLADDPQLQAIVTRFYEIADGMLAGKGRCIQDDFWGPCYWEPEEWAYLELCRSNNPEVAADDPEKFATMALLYARKSNMKRNLTTVE